MRASIPFSALPNRPTSLRGSWSVTRSVSLPAVIRSAWAAMVSMGRKPRRSSQNTPSPISSTAAAEPMITISRIRFTVLFTSLRLMPTTRIPPGAGAAAVRTWPEPSAAMAVRAPPSAASARRSAGIAKS